MEKVVCFYWGIIETRNENRNCLIKSMITKYLTIDQKTEVQLYEFLESPTSKPQERKRALAIIMSCNKNSVDEISQKLGMIPDTIYTWLIKFTQDGLEGLKNKPIPGRPRKLKIQHQAVVKETLKK